MKSKVFILLISVILVTSFLACALHQPSVHSATIYELEKLDGIGEVLAERVSLYLSQNPHADIEDLLEVEGIGKGKLEIIEKEYN